VSIWQAILIAGWVLAIIAGADKRLAFVMACNFAITALWPGNIGVVGIADLATIAALSLISPRGQVIGALYVLCAVINACGTLLDLPPSTTYAILDPIGWLMLAVLANVDSGIRGRFNPDRGSAGRGSVGMVDFMAKRHDLRYNMAVDRGENQR